MAEVDVESSRGILRPQAGLDRFRLSRRPPPPDLAPFIDNFWILHWDLTGRPAHRQQVLGHPVVHLSFTTASGMLGGRARIVGVVREVFEETIEGTGRVIGVHFRPGGFRPLLAGSVSALTGRTVPVADFFGHDGRATGDAVIAAADVDAAITLITGLLRARLPEPDPVTDQVAAIVRRIAADPSVVRVDALATELGVSVRTLQRLFGEYVGIGPKWVIRRYRMQEAADRAARGEGHDWAALAAELGFADQAHFVREFTATVGASPARYAVECRQSATP